VTATAGQPGIPLPEHDETTCAVCHASVTLTAMTLARAILPDAPAAGQHAYAPAGERLPRAPAARPTSSRAPPALRSA
jgi:putative intracellular protease/amidase